LQQQKQKQNNKTTKQWVAAISGPPSTLGCDAATTAVMLYRFVRRTGVAAPTKHSLKTCIFSWATEAY